MQGYPASNFPKDASSLNLRYDGLLINFLGEFSPISHRWGSLKQPSWLPGHGVAVSHLCVTTNVIVTSHRLTIRHGAVQVASSCHQQVDNLDTIRYIATCLLIILAANLSPSCHLLRCSTSASVCWCQNNRCVLFVPSYNRATFDVASTDCSPFTQLAASTVPLNCRVIATCSSTMGTRPHGRSVLQTLCMPTSRFAILWNWTMTMS